MVRRVDSIVVGQDGAIGSALYRELARRGVDVAGTSRRSLPAAGATVHLDLSADPIPGLDALNANIAYLCAAITGFASCNDDPVGTARVNVTSALAVARALMAKGTHVVFLSTSAVFDGSYPFPAEDSPGNPTTEYGRQKLLAEERLLAAARATGGSLAVVRLTKVLSPSQPLVRQFRDALMLGSTVEAFDDLEMSPLSLRYAVTSILELAAGRYTGIFHLSGDAQLSYAEFVRRLARGLSVDPGLVSPVRARDRGITPAFAPRFAALGMPRTTATSGILPQTADAAVVDLVTGAA